MADEKIITSDVSHARENKVVIKGDESAITKISVAASQPQTTLNERITASTESGGLKQLPENFDDENGDWQVIKSSDPFRILYLDYKLYEFVTPDIVSSNYKILQRFWTDKLGMMMVGGNRASFKTKYGDGTIENSQSILKKAYDKLSTSAGISQYYQEINSARLKAGADGLRVNIRQMTMDGDASKDEILFCFEEGVKYNLSHEETASIIKKTFDELSLMPYGTATGSTISEQLLSVEHWMTKTKINEAERIKKEKELLRVQILPGKYATTLEEMGAILFEDPAEAKEIIKEDLLKGVVGQKDMVLARDVAAICKDKRDLNACFLKIAYKLNSSLPYSFMGERFKNVTTLCERIFTNEQTMNQGKEEFQKGYIEAWIKETDIKSYDTFLIIRDSAENIDQALLTFIYTFCPQLPYRFPGNYIIKKSTELTAADKNLQNWNAVKTDLYNGLLPIWLIIAQKNTAGEQWKKIKNQFDNQDLGTEHFLHVLINDLPAPELSVTPQVIDYLKIQSGQKIETAITFTNTSRGYIAGSLSLEKNLPGVSLSETSFQINNSSGKTSFETLLKIDSAVLLKGINYQTKLIAKTSEGKDITIPVSFKITFPKNAFILRTVLYALIGAAFFALTRLLLASRYPSWLNHTFNAFLDWDTAVNNESFFWLFGCTFFLFLVALFVSTLSLIKYFRKK